MGSKADNDMKRNAENHGHEFTCCVMNCLERENDFDKLYCGWKSSKIIMVTYTPPFHNVAFSFEP
jgi:hypothetical protein